jgi:hypothetical protein
VGCGECGKGEVKNATACRLGGSFNDWPAAGEAAAQMKAMLAWIAQNDQASAVGLGLLSAWNENVEGHFVVPHWTKDGPNTTLLTDRGWC